MVNSERIKRHNTKNCGNRPALLLLFSAVFLVIGGCGSTPRPAPVIDRTAVEPQKPGTPTGKTAREKDWRPKLYTVQKGDTLYSIALDHGLGYKDLLEWNGIDNPNVIKIGQQLKLISPSQPTQVAVVKPSVAVTKLPANTDILKIEPKALKLPYSEKALAQLQQGSTAASPPPAPAAADIVRLDPASGKIVKVDAKPLPPTTEADQDDDERVEWTWPTIGKVLGGFSESSKGVNIGGKLGQPVLASAAGKVVYSGSGLRGYGKLIIIKHNNTYLSAYAHNSQILAKEGQAVSKGQKIAEMGNTDTDMVKLHFEIRKLGKPVDPVKYLPGSSG